MPNRALIVGIDKYENFRPLVGCVKDAEEMAKLLASNYDNSLNYECRVMPNAQISRVSRAILRTEWLKLFDNFRGNILFYFSGHGLFTKFGSYIVTQEGSLADPGLAMNELLQLANESDAQEVLLILDSCHSGALGDPANLQSRFSIVNQSQLREGVTILAASRPDQTAVITGGRSVFTNLILDALNGGAADVRGRVSAASVYAYAEQALGAFDQRPLYKSYAAQLSPIRYCEPLVEDNLLRELPLFFPEPGSEYLLDPTYEHSFEEVAIAEHIQIFDKFKKYRDAGLLITKTHRDLFYTAINSTEAVLTPLGKFYRKLAEDGRLGAVPKYKLHEKCCNIK